MADEAAQHSAALITASTTAACIAPTQPPPPPPPHGPCQLYSGTSYTRRVSPGADEVEGWGMQLQDGAAWWCATSASAVGSVTEGGGEGGEVGWWDGHWCASAAGGCGPLYSSCGCHAHPSCIILIITSHHHHRRRGACPALRTGRMRRGAASVARAELLRRCRAARHHPPPRRLCAAARLLSCGSPSSPLPSANVEASRSTERRQREAGRGSEDVSSCALPHSRTCIRLLELAGCPEPASHVRLAASLCCRSFSLPAH